MRFRLQFTAALLFVALSANAAEIVEDKRQLASSFVAEKVAVWQKRLHLEEWTISVVMARRTDMKQGTMGKIRWDKGKKTATLWALDAADYTLSQDEMLKDLEFTVVHELIHLELASLPKSEASRRSEEFAVNQLTEALLSLARQ
jgi:hypothetical protein